MNFIKRLIFGFTFILLASVASAKELKSDQLNYVVTVPDTWTVKSQDQTGFYVTSQDGKRSVDLAIVPAPFANFDSNYITKYEQILKKVHNLQLVSSKVFTIDGAPAYENIQRLGTVSIASVKVEHQIFADGRLYGLDTLVIGGDATQDSDLQEALNSFHFLHTPKPSGSFGFGGFGSLGVKLAIIGIIIAGIVFWAIQRRKI